MDVGLVGKPNVGKSTLFKALTLAETEIASHPFTTIKANIGVGYVRSKCACQDFQVKCNPKNGLCISGWRFTPIRLVEVAGLVPGTHKGKGLGNQFLDDLRQADVLIHVVDISGRTNELGEPTKDHDPEKDIEFLEQEIDLWFAQIVRKNWKKVETKIKYESKKVEVELAQILAGIGVRESHVKSAIENAGLTDNAEWSDEDCENFAFALRRISKPIVIAANKVDQGMDNYNALKDSYEMTILCAEAELALREADSHGLIEYVPGDGDFKILGDIDEKKGKGLEFIKEMILDKMGSTGAQNVLNQAVHEHLELITVYPVENETKLMDGKGNVLPDSFLVPLGSTVLDLAYRIHSDIGDKFIGAIDCRSKMKVKRDHELADCDVIKIISRA